MKTTHHAVYLLILCGVALSTSSWGDLTSKKHLGLTSKSAAKQSAVHLPDLALSASREVAAKAIDELRLRGEPGLIEMLTHHQQAIAQFLAPEFEWRNASAEDQRLRQAIDKIAGKRDAYSSELFWYTDFAQAQSKARKDGKTIVSLRLLGRLDEEQSCANSRFFRMYLYPDPAISRILKEKFILHWEPVREIPVMTVDFGDGRKIVRPITGNSIHYFLDSEGRVLDGLPGLYSPNEFAAHLETISRLSQELQPLRPEERSRHLIAYHMQASGSSQEAIRRAAAQEGRSYSGDPATLEEAFWTRWSLEERGRGTISEPSRNLIRAKNPTALEAGGLALVKSAAENPILRQFRESEQLITGDALRNEHHLHARIHEWLAVHPDLNVKALPAFNHRVYAELFLMPLGDPWLGLATPLSGIDDDGLTTTALFK